MGSKLAIFDYDGVIVDSLSHNLAVVRQVCEAVGASVFPDVEYCRTARCISFEEWARHIGMTGSQTSDFVRMVHAELTETTHDLQSFADIPQMFEQLSRNCKCALITANVLAAAKRFLDQNHLSKFFSALSGAETPGAKSEKITRLAENAGYSLSSIYYIGDAGTDVQQGRIAGVRTVAVTWGFQSRERLEEERPDFIVDSPMELLRVLAIG